MKRVSVISGGVTVLMLLMAGHGARAASCFPPPVGLVNWWPATGSANDIVGTNHGTLRNGTTFATGVVGQAFSFDGTNDFIQIGGTPIAPPWTAEFWVNRQASLEDSAVLIGDTNTALKLEQYPNTKKVGFTRWGVVDCYFNYTAPTNTWVHLVFVGNSNNTQLYVNGALQDTNPTNAPFALPRGQIGRDITNRYTKQLRGLVDEPSLYTRALASNEIVALYNAGAAGKCGLTTYDECAGAIQLTDGVAYATNTVSATSTNDPLPDCQSSFGKGVWFTFKPSFNGSVVISTCGSSFDTVLAVYTGNCDSLVPIVCNDDNGPSCSGTSASVTFSGNALTTYRILVGGYAGQSGNFQVTATTTLANDQCSGAVQVFEAVQYPVNTTYATSTGDPIPSCASYALRGVWFRYTPAANGKASISATTPGPYSPIIAVYTGSCGSLTPVTCGDGTTPSFTVNTSTEYKILIGGFQESVIDGTMTLYLCRPPVFQSVSSYSMLEADGVRIYYNANISGTGPFTMDWKFYSGASYLFTVPSAPDSISRLYGPFDVIPDSVNITPISNTCGPGTGGGTGSTPPPCGAICLSLGSTVTRVGSDGSGTNNYSLASPCTTFTSGGSRWFLMSKLTNAAAIAFVDSAGSAPDTVIGVFRGGINPSNLVSVACSSTTNQKPAYVEFETVPNYNYWLAAITTNSAALRFTYGYNLKFAPQSPGLSNGVLTVRSAPLPSLKFRLEATTNLNAAAWTPLLTNNFTGNATATNNILQWVDPNPAAYRQRYFRMVLQP